MREICIYEDAGAPNCFHFHLDIPACRVKELKALKKQRLVEFFARQNEVFSVSTQVSDPVARSSDDHN